MKVVDVVRLYISGWFGVLRAEGLRRGLYYQRGDSHSSACGLDLSGDVTGAGSNSDMWECFVFI